MIAALLASLALAATDPGPSTFQLQASPEPPRIQQQRQDQPVQLEDVVVTGRSLDSLIGQFVGEVAAPNRGRALARWDDPVCVGVANLREETAQYLVDRISTVAEDVGLRTGRPGCRPNILIVVSADADTLAQSYVEEHARTFRPGGAGMDRGGAALRAFQDSDQPVRWWQVSALTDSETGERVVRLPGDCRNACEHSSDYAPAIDIFAASRLRTQFVENLLRTIVIIDVDAVSDVSITQLADYVAMVSLAQVNPNADTSAYASILNVFNDPMDAENLTEWDKAYLEGLYAAQRVTLNKQAARSEVVDSIRDAHRRLRAEADGAVAE